MSNLPKIILFNGPPQSGKDFAANHVHIKYLHAFQNKPLKFANKLKHLTANIIGCSPDDFENSDFKKNVVAQSKSDATNRQALIAVSEAIKKIFGEGIFGHWVADLIESRNINGNILISDSGFFEEFEALYERLHTKFDFHIIEIHGRNDFTNDSRKYIGSMAKTKFEKVGRTKIYNTGAASDFLEQVDAIIRQLIL